MNVCIIDTLSECSGLMLVIGITCLILSPVVLMDEHAEKESESLGYIAAGLLAAGLFSCATAAACKAAACRIEGEDGMSELQTIEVAYQPFDA